MSHPFISFSTVIHSLQGIHVLSIHVLMVVDVHRTVSEVSLALAFLLIQVNGVKTVGKKCTH